MEFFNPSDRQREIYLGGLAGESKLIPIDDAALEKKAQSKLSKQAFDYIATGAGKEYGIENNLSAFREFQLMPRMATGVEHFDLSCTILNQNLKYPVLFAPIGVLNLAFPQGDLELAKASAISGIPMIFSNQASEPMEKTASFIPNGQYWFQLYFSKSRSLVESFVARAEHCGCKALVLTLDTTTLGWRQRDLESSYLPFLKGLGIAQYTSDPVFQNLLKHKILDSGNSQGSIFSKIIAAHRMIMNHPGSYWKNWITKDPIKAVRTFIELYSKPELSWDDLIWLRKICKIPLFIKGILHPEDAQKAVEIGVDGIIVSNHGGRQLDQVTSSLDALQNIRKFVPKPFPVLLDSGIRSGTDIFISLALGADAILFGRPYTYALALAGKRGVLEYAKNKLAELEITMKLTGCDSIQQISPEYLQHKKRG